MKFHEIALHEISRINFTYSYVVCTSTEAPPYMAQGLPYRHARGGRGCGWEVGSGCTLLLGIMGVREVVSCEECY